MIFNGRIIIYLIVLLLGQFFANQAYCLCVGLSLANVTATNSFQGGSSGYEVFDSSEYIQTVNFQVNGGASIVGCNYFVVLSAGQSGNVNQRTMSASDTLNYNVYVDSGKNNILKDISNASSNEVISGSFPLILGLNQTNNHSFYWTINPEQIVNPATYSDNSLTLSLYSGLILSSYTLAGTTSITFQATVVSSVDLSLVDNGAAFNISDTTQTVDFGTLETAEQQVFDVVIRSNDGYLVTMQSTNNEVLRHESYPTVSDTVNYSLTFNSGAIDLSSGSEVQVTSNNGGTTSATGTSFPVQVTVGTVSSPAAGTYSDVINVNVTAN